MKDIPHHLQEATMHLDKAIAISLQSMQENPHAKEQIGLFWEGFFKEFFNESQKTG